MINQKIKISQSLLKRMKKYHFKEDCGLKIVAELIDKTVKSETKEAAKAGIRFEYLVTGQLARGEYKGDEPLLTEKTKKVSADEKKVNAHVQNFLRVVNDFGIEIHETSKELIYNYDSFIHKGIADIFCTVNDFHETDVNGIVRVKPPHKALIDIKYSGLFGDKFSDYGWHVDTNYEFADNKQWVKTLQNKPDLTIQAIDYKCIWNAMHDEDIEFYFLIFDANDVTRYKLINVAVRPETIDSHMNDVFYFANMINEHRDIGLIPYPEYSRCNSCAVESCEYRIFHETFKITI